MDLPSTAETIGTIDPVKIEANTIIKLLIATISLMSHEHEHVRKYTSPIFEALKDNY